MRTLLTALFICIFCVVAFAEEAIAEDNPAEKEKIEKAEQVEKAAKEENENKPQQMDNIELPLIPVKFSGFAGMITGKVLQRAEGICIIEVAKVAPWKHSKAEDASSIIGREVAIKIVPAVYENKHAGPVYLTAVKRFFRLLKPGDVESFDVKCTDGQALTFLELTEAQREKVQKAVEKMLNQ